MACGLVTRSQMVVHVAIEYHAAAAGAAITTAETDASCLAVLMGAGVFVLA